MGDDIKLDTKALRLSVAMIVRDEEARLPRCLASLKDVADEIVVVDTGSVDHTPQIAKVFGTKLYLAPWQGNFSAARNESLKHVTGDWTLIIDADEWLDPASVEQMQHLMSRSGLVNYGFSHAMLRIRSYHSGMWGEHFAKRLIRNGVQAKYRCRVHNQLQIAGDGVNTSVLLHHDGYDLDPAAMAKKRLRTRVLLEQEIEDPEDPEMAPVNHYHLAVILKQAGEHRDAIRQAEAGIAGFNGSHKALQAACHYIKGGACGALGNLAGTEDSFRRAVHLCPEYLDPLYHLAEIVGKKPGHEQEAMTWCYEYLNAARKWAVKPSIELLQLNMNYASCSPRIMQLVHELAARAGKADWLTVERIKNESGVPSSELVAEG